MGWFLEGVKRSISIDQAKESVEQYGRQMLLALPREVDPPPRLGSVSSGNAGNDTDQERAACYIELGGLAPQVVYGHIKPWLAANRFTISIDEDRRIDPALRAIDESNGFYVRFESYKNGEKSLSVHSPEVWPSGRPKVRQMVPKKCRELLWKAGFVLVWWPVGIWKWARKKLTGRKVY